MEHVVAVVDDDAPSVALLTPHPGVQYVFVEPGSPVPDDVFECDALFT